jgi:hypothetical protein
MRRDTGRDRRSERIIDEDNKRLLKGVIQFAFLGIVLLISLAVLSEVEQVWTDFSPEVEEVTYAAVEETVVEVSDPKDDLDKEKYRAYFEDKSLVLMVLGGLEYWKLNCGTLSGTGDYFMNLAVKKHSIDINEMNMDASFQMGLFAATLYNDCDIFLEQTNSIGLGMMFKKTPQEIILDTVPETNI